MASAVAPRPVTDGTVVTSASFRRRPSFSSFPHSRSQSSLSGKNGRSHRSPSSSSKAGSNQSNPSEPPLPQRNFVRSSKLRSQYPADSNENHVEYILVASFDIDRGSIMEHQYPLPISGDEHMLAELMLPDQAHVRSQDWTIFFLHKDTSAEEEEKEERRERRRRRRRKELAQNSRAAKTRNGDAQSKDDKPGEARAQMGSSDDDSNADSEDEDASDGPPLIYVLNLVNTKQDNSVKR